MKPFAVLLIVAAVSAATSLASDAGNKKPDLLTRYPALDAYFSTPVAGTSARPDDNGFIRRWLLLEPVSKPNHTNTVFIDSYLRDGA